MIEKLKRFEAFQKLNDIQILAVIRHAGIRTCRTGKILYYQGDPAEAAHFMISGRIKKIKYRTDMTSVIMGRAYAGEWFGLAETMAGGPCLCDIVTEEESETMTLSQSSIMKLTGFPEFACLIIRELAKGYYPLHAHLETRTPLEKLTRFIETTVDTFGRRRRATGNYVIDITQENIAEAIGVTRETVNKYLQYLRDENIVTAGRGRIEILDPDRLKDISRKY